MTPEWLDETLRGFGRQMGLRDFAFNGRGAAGVRFENGISLRFEYAAGALVAMTTLAMPATDAAMKRLLTLSHPAARRGSVLRTAYLAKAGAAVCAVRMDERTVNVTALEAVFRDLWAAADSLRRALA